MRRIIVAALAIAAAVAVVAVPASGSTLVNHFSVLSQQIKGERVGNHAFKFKDELLNPFNSSNRVGRDKGICKFTNRRHKYVCKVVVHLDGEIGGFGNMYVRGNFGHGDNSALVKNGTGDFNGVVGKVKVHNKGKNLDSLHFDLVR